MRMSVKATLSVRHFCFEERVSTELLLEIEFVKSKLSEVSIIFIDIIDRLSEVINERVTDI